MRLFKSIEERHGTDDQGYEPPPRPPDEDYGEFEPEPEPEPFKPRLAGAIAAGLGGLVLVVASFLPLVEAPDSVENTLMQRGEWLFVILGVLAVLGVLVYYTEARRRYAWGVLICGLAAGAVVAQDASEKALRTSYTIGAEGKTEVLPFAIAIYLAGVGALLVFAGGWMMRGGRSQ